MFSFELVFVYGSFVYYASVVFVCGCLIDYFAANCLFVFGLFRYLISFVFWVLVFGDSVGWRIIFRCRLLWGLFGDVVLVLI